MENTGLYANREDRIRERELAEGALRESEERFRTLFASTPIGIFVTTFDARILAYNDAITAMTGYLPQELEQLDVRELYENPEERSQVLYRFKTEGSITGLELKLKRKDGAAFDASLTMAPFTFDGQDVLLTVLEDITERKQAEEKLKEQVEELQRWHSVTLGREGRVQELKREVNELLVRLDESIRYSSQEASK